MKKTSALVAPVALVIAFVACGSEAVDRASSAQSGKNDDTDAGGIAEAGGAMLDAQVADAAIDGDAKAATAPAPNPGKITCGPSECVVDEEACCITGDAGLCEEMGGACHSNGPNRARLECDEAADCREGEVCVLTDESEGISSACRSSSDERDVLACKTDADCGGTTGTCKTRTCLDGRSIRSCGPLDDLCP